VQLRFFETFVCLAKVRNFRKAADLLHTSQPVISSRINALEAELGTRLFERSKRSVHLTREGRLLLPHAEAVIEITNEMKWLVGPNAELTGSLRIGVAGTIIHSWFIHLMEAFRSAYPRINLEILATTSAGVLQAVRDHSVDVGLAMKDRPDMMLRFDPLCSFPIAWVASPTAFPIEKATLNTLLDMPILTFPQTSLPYRELERHLKMHSKIRPNIHPMNSIATIVKMAGEGLGIAPMPRAVVHDELVSGRLHEIKVDVAFPPLHFYAVTEVSPRMALKNEFARMAQQQARAWAEANPEDGLVLAD